MAPLLIATHNRGKLAELRQLAAGEADMQLVCLDDPGIEVPEVEETGETFAENATLKAVAGAKATGLATLADDSGLVVEALDGRPGIHSARYAGPGATDADRCQRLLGELVNRPQEDRRAYFVCAVAYVAPEDLDAGRTPTRLVEARCVGQITDAPRGTSGFGYDPIFYCDNLGKTFGEASIEEKRQYSHRGQAMRQMMCWLVGNFPTQREPR